MQQCQVQQNPVQFCIHLQSWLYTTHTPVQVFWLLQAAALAEAQLLQDELLRCETEAAAHLAAESARCAQAEEAVEQYIAAHYASQAAAQVSLYALTNVVQ